MPLKCQVIFILFGINSFIYHFPKLKMFTEGFTTKTADFQVGCYFIFA